MKEANKFYSPSEVAELMNISTSSVRRLTSALEEGGYTRIHRNNKNHRQYEMTDVRALEYAHNLINSDGLTQNEAIKKTIENIDYILNKVDEREDEYKTDELEGKSEDLVRLLLAKIDGLERKIDRLEYKLDQSHQLAITTDDSRQKEIAHDDISDSQATNNKDTISVKESHNDKDNNAMSDDDDKDTSATIEESVSDGLGGVDDTSQANEENAKEDNERPGLIGRFINLFK